MMKLVDVLRLSPAALAALALLSLGATAPLSAQQGASPIAFTVNGSTSGVTVNAGQDLRLATDYGLKRPAKIYLVVAAVDPDSESGFGPPIALERASTDRPLFLEEILSLPTSLPRIKVVMTAVAVLGDGTVLAAAPIEVAILSEDGD